MSFRNIMCDNKFFRILRLSLLSYHLNNYPSILCEMIHHCKDIFKSISLIVWKKNYVNLASFSWIIRFIRFYFYIFLGSEKKENFVNFSSLYETCSLFLKIIWEWDRFGNQVYYLFVIHLLFKVKILYKICY